MSMRTDNAVDEIKSKLDIVQVVSEYVQLRKAGTRMSGLCPFHDERTPSFSVSPDMQFWYCFGCNEGGDLISFVMRMEGLDFGEALRVLAQRAGVQLRDYDPAKNTRKQRLIAVNTLAAKFFHEVLLRSPKAAAALEYARTQRRLSDETMDRFLIGYAPDSWDATVTFLVKRGFKEEEVIAAGLASKREKGSGSYDRFRNRLMFPIRDAHGNVVGFTGRILPGSTASGKEEAKYVNTQQTELYNKSAVLFGFDLARQAIRKAGYAVVVEGNMDVVASHQAGVTNVVASSGTALTEQQLEQLKRLAETLVLSFDADAAGERAAKRGIDLAVTKGFSVRVLTIPEGGGKDPDECIKMDVTLWQRAIADAKPYMGWYIDTLRAKTDLEDPEAKKRAAAELLGEVAKLPEPVERAHWIKELSVMFETPETLLFEQVERVRGNLRFAQAQKEQTASREQGTGAKGAASREQAPRERVRAAAPVTRERTVAEHLLGGLLMWPELIPAAEATGLRASELPDEFGQLYSDFVSAYAESRTDESAKGDTFVRDHVARQSQDAANRLGAARLLAEREFGAMQPDERRTSLVSLIGEIQHLHASRRQHELMQAMATAEKAGDAAAIEQLQQELTTLMRRNA